MKTVNCLWLEHDDRDFKAYSDPIKTRWDNMFDTVFEITRVKTVEETIKALAKPEGTYQIFISDVLFPPIGAPKAQRKEHEKKGLDAVAIASKKNKLLVISYSYGLIEKYANLPNEARQHGAHIFRYISQIFGPEGQGPGFFCREIYNSLIIEKIVEDPIELEYDTDEPKITYIVSEIGEGTLKSLYKEIFEKVAGEGAELKRINAEYIVPGMSGAFVLKMIATDEKQFKANHLLKISRIKEALLKEIKNYPSLGIYAGRLLVRYLGSLVSDEGTGWHAIGAVFEEDTTSLLEWLTGSGDEGDVSSIMESLFFGGGLIKGYIDVSDPEKPVNCVSALSPKLSEKAQITLALKEFDKVIRTPNLGGKEDWNEDILREYLRIKQVGPISERQMPKNCSMYKCHGDLHSRNILVTRGKPHLAIIIDTSEFGIHHWVTDYSKLLIDLILSAYDRGVRSYEWSHMQHWMELSSPILRFQKLPQDNRIGIPGKESGVDDNALVRTAINWMINNLAKLCSVVSTPEKLREKLWEIQLAMGIDFMRGSYRTDLTSPKRVFSLMAAVEAFSAATSSFVDRKSSG